VEPVVQRSRGVVIDHEGECGCGGKDPTGADALHDPQNVHGPDDHRDN
jgi:hypothetical protein